MVKPVNGRPLVQPPKSESLPRQNPLRQTDAPKETGWKAKLDRLGDAIEHVGDEIRETIQEGAAKVGLSAYAPLQPPPVLKRPVVMIPGLTMKASSYDPLARQLSSNPKNGPVATFVSATGHFHLGGANGRQMSDAEVAGAKVFQLEYKDARAAPSDKAPEVAQLLREVSRLTKADDLDVVTHSAGGHDFREYLNTRTGSDRDIDIHRTVMIGPVSHGTAMGNIGAVLGGPLGLKDASEELGFNDPKVKQLDRSWPGNRRQIEADVTVIAVAGAPTIAREGGVKTGDGYVAVEDIDLPGAKTVVLQGADPTPIAHLKEVGYSGVVNEVGKALSRD